MITTPCSGYRMGTKLRFRLLRMRGLVAIASCCLLLAGCDKTNLKPITHLKIRLTDAPIAAQEVNVYIKDVSVNLTDDTAWVKLRTNNNFYNLLDYRFGKDTLIAEGYLPATRIIKTIRLTLGDDHTIKIDNEVYTLHLPAASLKDVSVLVNTKLNKNIEILTLDFDAAASVFESSKGNFQLKPAVSLRKQP